MKLSTVHILCIYEVCLPYVYILAKCIRMDCVRRVYLLYTCTAQYRDNTRHRHKHTRQAQQGRDFVRVFVCLVQTESMSTLNTLYIHTHTANHIVFNYIFVQSV